jgi:hypothetical protein
MSTATELLRRALDKWDAETAGWADLFEEIRVFLDAEPAIRKPMTDREIMEQARAMGFDDLNTIDFAIGVRYAEKRLGILEKHCGL